MTAWTVSVTMTAATDTETVDPSALDLFADQLATHHGAGGFDTRRLDASVSVESPSAPNAARRGAQLIAAAAHRSGLNGWHIAALEAVDIAELDRRNTMPQVPELLGMSELMAALGVSRQRLTALRNQGRLPEPIAVLKATPVWDKLAVDRWLQHWDRRAGRPRHHPGNGAVAKPASEAVQKALWPYQVHRIDTHHWYVQQTTTGTRTGAPYRTQREARQAADDHNHLRLPPAVADAAANPDNRARLEAAVEATIAEQPDPGETPDDRFWAAVLGHYSSTTRDTDQATNPASRFSPAVGPPALS